MIEQIARQIALQGGRAFFVGGWVRDRLLGNSGAGSDIDIEVYYLSQEQLIAALGEFGEVKRIGSNFQVLKVKGLPGVDFVLPEQINSTFENACRRRDFTVNALLMDIISGEIIDPLRGEIDLQNKTIRASNHRSLQDDPLRAYRAAQLAARLDFTIEPDTFELMKGSDLMAVSKERVLAELRKLLLLSTRPSLGLGYLEKSGLLAKIHPVLHRLVNCPQPRDHHPEGDCWQHTLLVVDQAASLKQRSQDPEVLMFAALLHDIGKPLVTRIDKKRITSYGHDTAGEELALAFLEELRYPKRKAAEVGRLVREHMRPTLLFKAREEVGDRAIRKLATRVNTKELLLLAEADYLGRDLKRDFGPIRQWMSERLRMVGLLVGQVVTPLVMGRDLVNRGWIPGPNFKTLLQAAFSLQLEGLNKEQILTRMEKQYLR